MAKVRLRPEWLRLRRAAPFWLYDAPKHVLDIFRPGEGWYEVFFTAEFAEWSPTHLQWEVVGLTLRGVPDNPPFGAGDMFRMRAGYFASQYRPLRRLERVCWLDVPEPIRAHVIAWAP